jgi:RNA polymerase sigma-70 factor (ECF subfamily)
LLVRLRQPDQQQAWTRFVDLYTPLLFHWARRLGLQQSDAADLVQEVFVVLVRELPGFTYRANQRFRGWLWTVFRNKHGERQRRLAGKPSAAPEAALNDVPSPAENVAIEEAEYRQYITRRALELMQANFQPATWKACWECVVTGRSSAEVAGELGITVNAVHLAKARVLRRLREELVGLLD